MFFSPLTLFFIDLFYPSCLFLLIVCNFKLNLPTKSLILLSIILKFQTEPTCIVVNKHYTEKRAYLWRLEEAFNT